jgi:FkbM family methyltransferase
MLSDEMISSLFDFTEKNVGAFDFQEALISDIFNKIVRTGDIVVDGGAHTGRHTQTLAALAGAKGRVYAFEPLPALATDLTRKYQASSNVGIIPKALSNSSGKTRFIFVKNNPSYSGIEASNRLTDAQNIEIEVETTTLDAELAGETSCRLIKLDVEGAEYLALSGALNILDHLAPLVLLENDLQQTATRYGYSREQFFDIFTRTGYRLFDITGIEITEDHWIGRRPHFDNFIAVKRPEDIDFVKTGLPQLLFATLLKMNYVIADVTRNIFTVMQWIASGQKVVLFGAGNRARLILENYPVPFAYAADNDPGKTGGKLCGIEIFSPAKLLEESKDLKIVIISLWGAEIQKQLIEMGFSPDRILKLNIH